MSYKEICYRCEALATSREHVPPLCLFPKSSFDFRKNLITVPSCDIHNSKKSQDDEFLMISLAGIVGNNEVGVAYAKTKVDKALRRKHVHFFDKKILHKAKSVIMNTIDGEKLSVFIGNPDIDRFIRCFESIAYGLYFHETKSVFEGNVNMIFDFIYYEDPTLNTLAKLMKKQFSLEFYHNVKKGENDLVFQYQFSDPDEFGFIALKLTFYGNTEVFISLQPNGKSVPFNLGIELIKLGKPVTIKLGDEEFKFNCK